ncbi:MAG: tetratricopeptide repeat protein [Nitrospinae bacterium]|nr:tetratricopeptide repeat protein [Nitrospinota bacterium]
MMSEARRETICPATTLSLAGAGLALLVFLVYGHTVFFGFLVNTDDQAYIFRNPYLRDLSLENLLAIFTNVHFDSYLPATLASYSADYTLWKYDPFGYHLTQVVLHAANSFLALAVLLLAGVSFPAALGTAAIYAVHPAHAESVVWISERKNLLSGFFIFLSLVFYLLHARERSSKPANLIVSFFAFVMALLSKPVAVVLPPALVLLDLFVLKRGVRLMEKVPFLAAALLAGVGVIYTQSGVGAIKSYAGGSPAAALLFMTRVYWDYFWSLIFPFSLSPHYYYPRPVLWEWQSWMAYIAVPWAAVAAATRCRTRPRFAFAAAWFFLWLLPVSNIVPLATLRQDRYLYLPSLAVILFLTSAVLDGQRAAGPNGLEPGGGRRSPGAILAWLFRSDAKRGLAALGAAVLLFSHWTIKYSYDYASSGAVWKRAADLYPDWSGAQFESGYQCWVAEKTGCAIHYYRRAISADPDNVQALGNLGAVLIDRGQYSRARPYLERALKADPDYAPTYYNLAAVAEKTGKDKDKIPEWLKQYEELQAREKKKKDYRLGAFRFR